LRGGLAALKLTKLFGINDFPAAKDSGKVLIIIMYCYLIIIISNGNRTEWSPVRSVIIRVITKSDDRAAGVRFVHHEYYYRPNWTTRSLITN